MTGDRIFTQGQHFNNAYSIPNVICTDLRKKLSANSCSHFFFFLEFDKLFSRQSENSFALLKTIR